MKKQREPKDIDKYISPLVAGARLINLAVDNVLCRRKGCRVKWELKLSYFYAPEYQDGKAIVRPMGGTFVSGDPVEGMD